MKGKLVGREEEFNRANFIGGVPQERSSRDTPDLFIFIFFDQSFVFRRSIITPESTLCKIQGIKDWLQFRKQSVTRIDTPHSRISAFPFALHRAT